MRVLHTESSLNWGGQEFRTLLEHQHLNTHHHHSWLMCHKDSELYKRSRGTVSVIAIDLSKRWNMSSAFKILMFCRKHNIDVINSHSSKDSFLCLAAFFYGIPLIRSRQVTNPVKGAFSYNYLCSHIMAAAEKIKSILVAEGVNKNQIAVVGEGIDLSEFNEKVEYHYLKEEFSLKKDDKIVINIGMIREDKGQRYLLAAAKNIIEQNPSIKFFLIGEATECQSLESELKAFITQHHLQNNFIMTGYRNDVAAFMNLADLVVVASTGTEAQSRIVPQAFATKKTVVSTDTGGLTELVFNDNNGLIVPAKDAAALEQAINAILNDTELKSRLEKQAYQFAIKELSFKKMMDKILSVYKDTCNR